MEVSSNKKDGDATTEPTAARVAKAIVKNFMLIENKDFLIYNSQLETAFYSTLNCKLM